MILVHQMQQFEERHQKKIQSIKRNVQESEKRTQKNIQEV